MRPILAGAVMKGVGLTIGVTAGYAIYKSGALRPVALEVLKAGYKARDWVASAALHVNTASNLLLSWSTPPVEPPGMKNGGSNEKINWLSK
jgi:hypothetical protein